MTSDLGDLKNLLGMYQISRTRNLRTRNPGRIDY